MKSPLSIRWTASIEDDLNRALGNRLERLFEGVYGADTPADVVSARLNPYLDSANQRPSHRDTRRAGFARAWIDMRLSVEISRKLRLPAGMGAAVALALVLTLVLGPLLDKPTPVSAQVILSRAQAATQSAANGGVASYHEIGIMRIPGPKHLTSRSEVWYGGANLQRHEWQEIDGSGQVVNTTGSVLNGQTVWIYQTSNGHTHAIQAPASAWAGQGPRTNPQSGLDAILAQYNASYNCMNAELRGNDTVINRPAYVLELTPDSTRCAQPASTAAAGKSIAGKQDVAGKFQLTIWVDKETYLPLKTVGLNDDGTVFTQEEATSLDLNQSIPAGTFTYQAPAGVSVQVLPANATGAEVMAALNGTSSMPTLPKACDPNGCG